MKKRLFLPCLLLLLALLCACGGASPQGAAETAAPVAAPAPTETAGDAERAEPQPEPAQEPTPTPEPKPEAEPEPEPEPPTDPSNLSSAEKKRLAEALIDHPVSECYAAIGYPESSDYAPSCLSANGGDDGNLYYDGFIVYTFRDRSGKETIIYVE